MAELVDAPDLGSGGVTCSSSSLDVRTNHSHHCAFRCAMKFCLEVCQFYAYIQLAAGGWSQNYEGVRVCQRGT